MFAVTALLGHRFIPRIRDLPSKRLHVFDPKGVPTELKGPVGDRIRENTISANWPDVLRSVATMASGTMPPSQLLRKFASYPRQHDLAVALREIGRVERTLFMIDWLLDVDMQRRASLGLNKGEAHHALKSALRIRIAGLNLLTAIIIYWNTDQLGRAIRERKRAGLEIQENLPRHISPLGWEHIHLTGECRWPRALNSNAWSVISPRAGIDPRLMPPAKSCPYQDGNPSSCGVGVRVAPACSSSRSASRFP